MRTLLSRIYSKLYYITLVYIRVPICQWRMRDYKILSFEDTIRLIREQRLSVSRYGDGEFSVLCSSDHDSRSSDQHLVTVLHEIITSPSEGMLVCVPHAIRSMRGFTPSARSFWSRFLLSHEVFLHSILDVNRIYGDALFSRFYIDYLDRSSSSSRLSAIRCIWSGQKVFVVEGRFTRSGVGNDLYSECISVHRLLCPPVDAFLRYDDILAYLSEHVSKDSLILIFLGVTATALAYDLHKLGFWAIDIGHLDIEYEWMRLQTNVKSPVPGKYVLEAEGGKIVGECNDPCYQAQIVGEIL